MVLSFLGETVGNSWLQMPLWSDSVSARYPGAALNDHNMISLGKSREHIAQAPNLAQIDNPVLKLS